MAYVLGMFSWWSAFGFSDLPIRPAADAPAVRRARRDPGRPAPALQRRARRAHRSLAQVRKIDHARRSEQIVDDGEERRPARIWVCSGKPVALDSVQAR